LSFDSFTDFLAMGGHAAYVWPAYGLGLVVLAGLVLAPARARRRFFAVEGERARRFASTQRDAARTGAAPRMDAEGARDASDPT